MIHKPAETEQAIERVLAERWSGRAYNPDIAVSEEQIIALSEAARWAPSCYGDAPWRYLLCNKFTDKAAWDKVLDSLAPGNQEWARNAPLLIVAASTPDFSHNGASNRWSGYDTGAASISLCLQATAMGLVSHQMGGFDADKLRQHFSIPETIQLWAVIAVGHPAELDSLSPEQR